MNDSEKLLKRANIFGTETIIVRCYHVNEASRGKWGFIAQNADCDIWYKFEILLNLWTIKYAPVPGERV